MFRSTSVLLLTMLCACVYGQEIDMYNTMQQDVTIALAYTINGEQKSKSFTLPTLKGAFIRTDAACIHTIQASTIIKHEHAGSTVQATHNVEACGNTKLKVTQKNKDITIASLGGQKIRLGKYVRLE